MNRMITLAIIFLICLTQQSFAQFNYAVQGGVNLGSTKSTYMDESHTSKLSLGIRLGLIAERPIKENLTLHTGIIYSQKGGLEKETDDGDKYKEKAIYNYLDLPILLKFPVGNAFLLGGVTASYGVGGKYVYTETYDGETDKETESISFGSSDDDDYSALDFAVTVGIGFPIDVAGYPIVINGYYSYGLSDIAALSDGDVKLSTISLGATYYFNGDKTSKPKKKKTKKADSDTEETEESEYEEW